MSSRKVKLTKVKCLRCGYSWVPKVEEVILCAKCRSPYWNKPVVRHFDNKGKKNKRR